MLRGQLIMRMPSSFRHAPHRGNRLSGFAAFLFIFIAGSMPAVTFVVTNASDSGLGTLRQAITDANGNFGPDNIHFQIPGTAPFTINLSSVLPPLNETVVLDATTQSGYVNHPVIELNGTGAGSGSVGLRIAGGNCTVRGLAINRFNGDGIRLDSSGNLIVGNYIGTDVNGTLARGNTQYGIFVFGTGGNTIGGTNAADRNVISGGNETGIYLLNPTAAGNVILGNYIGLNAAGTAALGNINNGITLFNAPTNTVGGAGPGARNVIAANGGSGINFNGGTARGNVIQGNYIGVNATGTAALANAGDGLTLNSAPANQIGGTNTGEGNLISGNAKAGIYLNGAGTAANRIEGNLIGTAATGLTAIGNSFAGVTLVAAVSNQIGGTVVAARNLISGNRQDGIFASSGALGNRLEGNFIGVNLNGTAALSNALTGVTLDNSSFNLISGNPAATRAVIAANGDIGVWIKGSTAKSNTVAGVFIGTAANGNSALGNVRDGVRITDGAFNQVGGLTVDTRNVLSGNGFVAGVGAGILIEGTAATGNSIQGNHIGTDLNGAVALANRTEGVYLDRARGNSIGGDVVGAGNLISGNTTRGLRITNAWSNLILGNKFGIASNGVSSLANGQFNIEFEENSISNVIGSLAPGAGNVIAFSGTGGGARSGIRMRDFCTNNAILGNSFFSNADLAIDLGGLGVNGNDNCDGDTGANQLQNFPLLSQAFGGVHTAIRGSLNSIANKTYRLQFFASPSCDPLGNGEGQVYLGDKLLAAGAGCSNAFVALLPVAVTPGWVVTATATDPANNTSEFSGCFTVTSLPKLSLTTVGATQVSLAWTNLAPGFVLKECTNLVPPLVWTTVTNVPVNSGGQFLVTLARQGGQRFYRLNFE